MTTYYTEAEFEKVLTDRLIDEHYRLKANPDKDLTGIGWADIGEVEYAIRGQKVLRTKRDKNGFSIIYPEEKPINTLL